MDVAGEASATGVPRTDRGAKPSAGIPEGPLGQPLSHVSYVVDDLLGAVDFWVKKMHAGPFFLIEHVPFDKVEYQGAPATFDHTTALGQWGQIVVEIQQLHTVEPEGLREKLDRPINHVAYVCPDAAAASKALTDAGMPLYLEATLGPIHVRFHDAPQLGHSIEIHQACEPLEELYAELAEASAERGGVDLFIDRPDADRGEVE